MGHQSAVAVITGSEGGIGQALCGVFAKAGYRVVGLDLPGVPRTSGAHEHVACDLEAFSASESTRAQVLEQVRKAAGAGGVSVLVNNAAVQILGSVDRIRPEHWSRTLAVNLLAPFYLAQGLLSDLERNQGAVVNVSSIHAELTKPEFVCYATSKSALVGLTRSMAVDLGSRVRVNAVLPAAVETPMLKAGFEGREAAYSELQAMHPVGRIATPEEVAAAVLLLASPSVGFMTGAALRVDGGIGARLHDPV